MNELRHYGIIGMKWGVRRYQNNDGSYTAAGKARYGSKGEFKAAVRADRKTAYKNSTNLADADYALRKANKKVDQLNEKLKKAEEKGRHTEGIERLRETELATQSALQKQFDEAYNAANRHMNELMTKYGKEHVKEIIYDEKVGYGKEDPTGPRNTAVALGATAISVAAAAFAGVPFVAVMAPATYVSRGNQRYQEAKTAAKMHR